MAEQTQYIVFERVELQVGTGWVPIGDIGSTSPKGAIEALVAARVAEGEPRAEEYGACPVRNWSAGPVEVESKPTVRANVTSGYVGKPRKNSTSPIGRVEEGGEYPAAPVSSANDAERTPAVH